ncbi:MAG TPA: putative DNA-binding domain-containing protein [Burkholderiaceae bacterium]|nr:putative DNA-binding domain-containing protein [Burkholderiaceae bacterium]
MSTLEAQQNALLQALFAPGTQRPHEPVPPGLQTFIAENAYPTSGRGLNCYKSNAHALAERVLCAAYPVVTAILSADSMAQLARALWHTHPPLRGDMAHWGADLPAFVANSPQLADLPWLADVARVEWALHLADAAEDVSADLSTLARLADRDPAQLTLSLAPGLQVLHLAHAVVPVLNAHRQPDDAACEKAIAALGHDWCPPVTEHVLVWRVGHRPAGLTAISPDEAGFLTALLAAQPLLPALESCELDFSAWLPVAVQQGWVLGVVPSEGHPSAS